MSKYDKLLARLQTKPKDFTWRELVTLLRRLGYELHSGSGSRRKFRHKSAPPFDTHEPHPQKVVKRYVIDQLLEVLEEGGFL
jgi:predicted RNA binding protein YcfA (HicA-like mRNA interferase family)